MPPSGRPLLLFQRANVACAEVLAARELVRPRPLAGIRGVIRELVAHVLEASEVVRAREVRAQPIVRPGALALRVGTRALEVLESEIAARRQMQLLCSPEG